MRAVTENAIVNARFALLASAAGKVLTATDLTWKRARELAVCSAIKTRGCVPKHSGALCGRLRAPNSQAQDRRGPLEGPSSS
jgi:hypothetical protein